MYYVTISFQLFISPYSTLSPPPRQNKSPNSEAGRRNISIFSNQQPIFQYIVENADLNILYTVVGNRTHNSRNLLLNCNKNTKI